MTRLTILTLIFSFFLSSLALGQNPTPPDGMSGSELRTWLRQNWYQPWHDDLGYGPAREAMFGSIDAEGGQIYCVYTGFNQASATVTFPDPINTEHTVPQSMFDSQVPMRSDIHHLFPTHMDANSARGNLSFSEVNDQSTDVWLIGNSSSMMSSSNIPSSNIDSYSEVFYNNAFEPREDQKGNTARAIFYFFTMYPFVGDISEVGNLEWLYAWHLEDPADAEEIERNEEIQAVQGNYNPYISIPDLAGLAWGFVSGLEEIELEASWTVINGVLTVNTTVSELQIELYDLLGNSVRSTQYSTLDVSDLPSGIYLLRLKSESSEKTFKIAHH